MTDDGQDTDTLLAILSSLLPTPQPAQHLLLEALIKANGDVQAAGQAMLEQGRLAPVSSGKKRKRVNGLDGWLTQPSKPTRARSQSPVKQTQATNHPATLHATKPSSSSTISKPFSRSTHSSNASSSSSKPVVNLMDVLRPPPPATTSVPRPLPLTLSNPVMVAEHTPCTLHPSVLPPELACRVLYTMLDQARDWQRNKWWLFDRLVESPHRSSFYTRSELGQNEEVEAWRKITRAWYNGRESEAPTVFPPAMEEACKIIEKAVNEELHKRTRFPLEWGGDPSEPGGENVVWRANFAAANCYEGAKESVGFHSDRLTSIGPYPTIASLSLGTPRVFRLREVIPVDEADKRAARTYNIPLPHNSLLIMHASTQERFKHAVPPQSTLDKFHPTFPPPAALPGLTFDPANCRINITFRFFRPDFHPDTIPRCKCGEMTTLRPDMKQRQKEQITGGLKGKGRDGDGDDVAKRAGAYRYWWCCTAGDQNEGKGCGYWKVMDVKAEGRGPFAMDV
ncbi:hypothetical protein BV25DRAFT_1824569 [Artomyces pyxidatus]|uniref:Uncharacterized protein n=1 Tax=Artomyces pyxidatus TaxID=48021 RepID=A0ACB8T4W8_9AGAM|nr:hypothetical protein BV25DRAFT_1824569 [Artomyces pyxidatus]